MPRNPRYDVLFEPMRIGRKLAKNRFFQVPHASGMTNAAPHVRAAFRGMKAEGGWVRCTQNPTAGEEWRRDWHPERVRRNGAGSVLVVGGGPAGLEAALTLARRGYDVALADRAKEFGGRLRFETGLPGMKTWNRVAEYRLGQLRQMANVALYPDSDLSAQDVLDFGADHVVVATGARWLPLLCGGNELPAGMAKGPRIYTPEDLAAGILPNGPVAVFDFDNYYLGTAIAEDLSARGLEVTYITTAGAASAWTFITNEQPLIHQALARRGIGYRTLEIVTGFDGETLRLAQIFSGQDRQIAARSLVIVGQRQGGSALHAALDRSDLAAAGIRSLHLTGDANAPGAIAHAVYQGHKTAQELGRSAAEIRAGRDAPFAPRDFDISTQPPGPRNDRTPHPRAPPQPARHRHAASAALRPTGPPLCPDRGADGGSCGGNPSGRPARSGRNRHARAGQPGARPVPSGGGRGCGRHRAAGCGPCGAASGHRPRHLHAGGAQPGPYPHLRRRAYRLRLGRRAGLCDGQRPGPARRHLF
jgi:hypothetical protein